MTGVAMVKITNGTVTTEVTQGAYDTFYKEQGFVIVSDENENIEWEGVRILFDRILKSPFCSLKRGNACGIIQMIPSGVFSPITLEPMYFWQQGSGNIKQAG